VATTVDDSGDAGLYTSIALDSSDNVHISYYDAGNNALEYATNTTGEWVATMVDDSGDVGLYTSIAVDGSGGVHISYYDAANGALKYATGP